MGMYVHVCLCVCVRDICACDNVCFVYKHVCVCDCYIVVREKFVAQNLRI